MIVSPSKVHKERFIVVCQQIVPILLGQDLPHLHLTLNHLFLIRLFLWGLTTFIQPLHQLRLALFIRLSLYDMLIDIIDKLFQYGCIFGGSKVEHVFCILCSPADKTDNWIMVGISEIEGCMASQEAF